MNKTKNISVILFGSIAWLICAVALPMGQSMGTDGLTAKVADLVIGQAYAEDDNEAVCVSLVRIEEGLTKEKDEEVAKSKDEHDKSKDEHDKEDVERAHKADEDGYAKAEHDGSDAAFSKGDRVGKSDHDSKAKDHEDKAKDHEDKVKDHEDKAKDHEDKAKDHEDKAKDHEDKAKEVVAVTANCTTKDDQPGAIVLVPRNASETVADWVKSDPILIAAVLNVIGNHAYLRAVTEAVGAIEPRAARAISNAPMGGSSLADAILAAGSVISTYSNSSASSAATEAAVSQAQGFVSSAYVAAQLNRVDGLSVLVNSATSGSGASGVDSSVESYREIHGD